MTMQQHYGDISGQRLADLFDRSINLSGPVNNDHFSVQQSDLVDPKGQAHDKTPEFTYSISQHYTHSAHIVNALNAHAVHTPAIENHDAGLSIYQTLAQHNIQPGLLLPSQINLFQQADHDQRSRLIQLWSISPPGSISDDGLEQMAGGIDEYQNLMIEQRAEQARVRGHGHLSMGCPGNDDMKVEHVRVPTVKSNREDIQTAELYMKSGYEQLAQRDYQSQEPKMGLTNVAPSAGMMFDGQYKSATDPVYRSTGWQLDDMEHQYGKFDQISNFQVQAQDVVHIREPEDEEML